MDDDDIYFIDRKNGEKIKETVLGDSLLRLAYKQPWRSLFGSFLFKTGFVSNLIGKYCDSRRSIKKIEKTIAELDIDVSEFADALGHYKSFNEFFYRHLRDGARPYDESEDVLCCPADCRLTVYPKLNEDLCIPVKGASISMPTLLGGFKEAEAFKDGVLFLCRLCPADYHRYHFPAAGTVDSRRTISGRLHSVNPVAQAVGIPVFDHNYREVSILDLGRFGKAAYVEVGAFGVSGIISTHNDDKFTKMAEKGYFRFGGSTVILVLEKNKITIDKDLVENSANGLETRIKVGDSLGKLN